MRKLRPKQNETADHECNCSNQEHITCPVSGHCETENVVYEAQVKVKNTFKSYIGMTSRPFIERWKEHKGNVKYPHQKGTKLSGYIHKPKEFGEKIGFQDIKWSIKARAAPYRSGTKYCDTGKCSPFLSLPFCS